MLATIPVSWIRWWCSRWTARFAITLRAIGAALLPPPSITFFRVFTNSWVKTATGQRRFSNSKPISFCRISCLQTKLFTWNNKFMMAGQGSFLKIILHIYCKLHKWFIQFPLQKSLRQLIYQRALTPEDRAAVYVGGVRTDREGGGGQQSTVSTHSASATHSANHTSGPPTSSLWCTK